MPSSVVIWAIGDSCRSADSHVKAGAKAGRVAATASMRLARSGNVNPAMVDISTESGAWAGAVACPDCGAAQRIGFLGGNTDAFCWRCGEALERAAGRSTAASLACAAAGFLLLFPGNVLPVMRSNLVGASLEAHAIDGAVAYWRDGWPLTAVFVGLFAVAIPFVRSAMLIAVLGSLYLGYRRRWQGLLFRHAEELRLWSMPGVYVLAGI